MSDFFESEIIQKELEEINYLQEKNLWKFIVF